ncbi:MAG: hypothetical protein BJ554DRAFT_7417 [Olpidium bornovanus]|uniref:Annexin n=1 Tax=Olpidium bornovanus TaxID=278681 RepID=A0A8H8DJ53_9FUNG|nr:MAG: hypothetical protein BJ554DRAFT_7417 [Olpidium bornovanus]
MAGATVRDATLIRLVTRFRHPLTMNPIKEAYHAKFGTPLEERIAKTTARDYGRLLLALVARSGGPAQPDAKSPCDSAPVVAGPALPCDAPP